jgi:uncharacterized protein YbcI
MRDNRHDQGVNVMPEIKLTMAQQVANAAIAFQQQRTGHTPQAVTVVLSGETLVITLHGALTPAEQALAGSAAGAVQVQEFHRQLFASSSEELRREIKRITGVEVREAAAEVETATGTVVHAFTSGTMVQVFLLNQTLSAEVWGGNGNGLRGRDGQTAAPNTKENPGGTSPAGSIETS